MTTKINKSVFMNCPFDDDYNVFFDALCFAIQICGFLPRCALEQVDSAGARLDKIQEIIDECRFGIHDISRVGISKSGLPRFNMPFELGLFFGAKRFGGIKQKNKSCIIIDVHPYRYRESLSDLSGQDIACYNGEVSVLLLSIRNYLQTFSAKVPGGECVVRKYNAYNIALPALCKKLDVDQYKLGFLDRRKIIYRWLTLGRGTGIRSSTSRKIA
jgi:hypothetical protein